jgi:hypothetical protein
MKRGKSSELVRLLGPAVDAFQELKADLKAKGIAAPDLPGLLALAHLLASGSGRGDGKSGAVPGLSMEGVGLTDLLSPPPPGRIPYIRVVGYWFLAGESPEEKVEEINRILKRLIGRWQLVEYFFGGWKREFPYQVIVTAADLETLSQSENRWLKIIYKDQENRYLTLETNLLGEEPLILSLTCHHPDFIQGVHNLEDDFFEADRANLLELMEDLQLNVSPGVAKYSTDEVVLEELGDRYNVSYFDE